MSTAYVGPPELKTAFETVESWLSANGIDEMIPEKPTFTLKGGTLTYKAFGYEGEYRGFDASRIRINDARTDLVTEDRTIQLIEPPTDAVRAAFRELGTTDTALAATLIEA